MKKTLLILILFFITQQNPSFANKAFMNDEGLWGVKNSNEQIIIEPEYSKLILLGDSAYIVQKRGKFGLIDFENNILIPIKYSQVERLLGKYLKIGTGNKYGLYNEHGKELLPVEYSTIDILFNNLFLTCKSNKYGIVNSDGKTILANEFDNIYMPKSNVINLKHLNKEYQIEYIGGDKLTLPEDITSITSNKNYIISEITDQPVTVAGYSAVTFTDYILKLVSSISPAHEKTIDTLMFSKGMDAVGIYFKLGWIPKYPVHFVKNYYNTVKNPNNGPLSKTKNKLKQKLAE